MVTPSPSPTGGETAAPVPDPPSTTSAAGADAETELLLARIDELEEEVASLREGLATRQQIGFVTGVLAQRHGLQPDQAWDLLAHASQEMNVKVRRVARVLADAYSGQLSPSDVALAARITAFLPNYRHNS
jgi:hypothetical protein